MKKNCFYYHLGFGLAWFLCSMANQLSWVIQCKIHLFRRTGKAQFNPYLGDKCVHTYPKDISSKINVIVRLEFKLAYCNVTVSHVSHYDTETLLTWDLLLYSNPLCPDYDTKLYSVMRLQFQSFRKCGVPLQYHYYPVYSDTERECLLESIYESNRSVWKLFLFGIFDTRWKSFLSIIFIV